MLEKEEHDCHRHAAIPAMMGEAKEVPLPVP